MQGYKLDQSVRCNSLSLRHMIPNDHLLVRIHEAKELEFSFIYEITKNRYCANYGRPSIDPVLFFRMQIISYLYGIKSNRRLCKEIQLNIAYRWFCGLSLEDKVPDHSSLSRIRDRFGVELFQEIFISLIKQWYELDIIKGETIISDASLVESNASMNSLILRKDQGDSQKRDTYSRVAICKLYTEKSAITSADILNDRVIAFFNHNEIPLLRILTDRGTEYCGKVENHAFELYLAIENIDHSKTRARSPQTNGICERFHRTLKEEFYDITFRKKIYNSLENLQIDLDQYLSKYNNSRPHSGKFCYGKTPMQTFTDSIKIAKDKSINSYLSDSSIAA